MKTTKRQSRGNGQGTLERRGNIYFARWVVAGKRFTRSTGTGDKREAEKRLAEFVKPFDLKSEKATLESLAGKVQGITAELAAYEEARPALSLVDGFAAYSGAEGRGECSAGTLNRYESYYEHLQTWLAVHRPAYKELRAVTAADAAEYAADFLKNHSPGTFNKHFTFLRCMWRVIADAEADGVAGRLPAKLPGNPFERIRRRMHEPYSRRSLTVEELRRVCSSVEGEMRTLFAVGIYTGLRLGDAVLLDWGEVDLARGMISLIPRKTARHAHGRRTVIPLHGALAAVLSEIPSARRRGAVMPGLAAEYRRGSPLVTTRIKAVFEAAGIATNDGEGVGGRARVAVGFHSLRHSFVSLAANAGAPLAVVQAMVGHSTSAMTEHYYHESEDALKKAVAALPAIDGKIAEAAGADAAEGRFSRLCEVLDGMDAAELRNAAKEIKRRLAK